MPVDAFKLRGVFVPLLTPFQADGALDLPALDRLVEYLLAAGVHGLFVGGTTGEFPLLSTAERQRVAETAVAAAAGRVPVVIHAGAPSTREAIQLAVHAQHIGAPAIAVVAPYFFPLSDEALRAHYVAVAAAVPRLPMLLYNIPQRTVNALPPRLVADIVRQCPNVVGIKDSSGNLSQTIEYCALRADFQVAQGADGLLVAGLAVGIQATVSGNANVFPELAVAVFEAWWRGDQAAARAAQAQFDAIRRPLRDGMDLSLFKRVLARRGVEVGEVRAPLRAATQGEVQAAVEAIEAAGVAVRPLVAR
ncbi:MAG TPA: dihydrodipicolinate synthase family protein [Chloroflexota bacterium]